MTLPAQDFQKTPTGFKMTCPECGKWHEFTWVLDDMLILDGNERDDFTVVSNGRDSYITPQFICRNLKCKLEPITLIIEVL